MTCIVNFSKRCWYFVNVQLTKVFIWHVVHIVGNNSYDLGLIHGSFQVKNLSTGLCFVGAGVLRPIVKALKMSG